MRAVTTAGGSVMFIADEMLTKKKASYINTPISYKELLKLDDTSAQIQEYQASYEEGLIEAPLRRLGKIAQKIIRVKSAT